MNKNDLTKTIMDMAQECQNVEQFLSETADINNGPFSAGKIFSHLDRICLIKNHPKWTKPITLELHLTNKCPHNCPYCMFKDTIHATEDKNKWLPEFVLNSLVKDVNELDIKGIVYSGGGEPLAHPSAIQMFQNVKSQTKAEQGLITNGFYLSDKVSKVIIQTMKWVRISVDGGSEQTYSILHGVKGRYDKLVNDIKHLIECRNGHIRPRIGVSFLLNMLNYKDLLPFIETFKNIGVDYVQIKPLIMSEKEKIESGNILKDYRIFELLKEAKEMATDKFGVYILGLQFQGIATQHKLFSKCHGHALYPVISANGNVYVCCMLIGNETASYGNILQNSLQEIWHRDSRYEIGLNINPSKCPPLCRLSETNKMLEQIIEPKVNDFNFLN